MGNGNGGTGLGPSGRPWNPGAAGTDPTGTGLAGAAGLANKAVANGPADDAYSLGGAGAENANGIINGYGRSAQAADGRSGAQINLGGDYGDDRASQNGLMGSYMGVVNGTGGPSQAELGRQAGQQQVQNSMQSMAAGARGGPAAQAAAQRMAMTSGGQAAADNQSQANSLHANEVNQARAGAAGLANNMAGTSAGLASQQGQLDNSRLQQNDARNMHYATLGMQGQQLQQEGMEEAGRQQQDAQKTNIATAQHNADSNKNLLDSAVGAAGSVVGGIGSLFSDANLKTGIKPAGDDGGQESKAAVTHDMLNNSLTPDKTTGGPNPQATYDDGIGAGKYASQISKLISDEDQKKDIKPSAMRQALDKMQAVSFEYKNKALGVGRRAGITTEMLKASPAGSALVEKTPVGESVDIPKATGFNLAAGADLHHRQSDTEEKVKAIQHHLVAQQSQTLNRDSTAAAELQAHPARDLPKGVEETTTKIDPSENDGPRGERQHDRYIAYHDAKRSGDFESARKIKADFVGDSDPEEAAAMRKNDAELKRMMKSGKPVLREVSE